MTRFAPTVAFDVEAPLDHHAFVKEINRHAPVGSPSCAIRVDGEFEIVHARSVPRQRPPYGTLADAAAQQREFDFHDVTGTMVGFRFPDYAEGIELPGFHLHFVDAAREHGGHVLSCRPARVHVEIDHASYLHMELPPGVALPDPTAVIDRAALRRIEGGSGREVEATAALLEPARKRGVEYEQAAIERALEWTAGYPFYIQQLGKHAWNLATGSPITLLDVEAAIPSAVAALDSSVYEVRIQRATPAERVYLRAMAEASATSALPLGRCRTGVEQAVHRHLGATAGSDRQGPDLCDGGLRSHRLQHSSFR